MSDVQQLKNFLFIHKEESSTLVIIEAIDQKEAEEIFCDKLNISVEKMLDEAIIHEFSKIPKFKR